MLAALSKLKLDVALSESDIGKVEVGQSATVTINAASGEKVAGHVTGGRRALRRARSSTGSGAVSYPVTVTLDQTTEGIKAGMSATADIVVARASGIVVPSQALRGNTVTVTRTASAAPSASRPAWSATARPRSSAGSNAGDQVIVTSTSVRSTGDDRHRRPRTGHAARAGFGGAGGFGGGGAGATRRFGGRRRRRLRRRAPGGPGG